MPSRRNLDTIPLALKEKDQWVCWNLKPDGDGRTTKVPVCARGGAASSTDSSTWASFEEAVAACANDGHSGIGFVFAPDRSVTGLDLDHVLGEDGSLAEEYRWVVEEADTYTEVSPSGDGLHLFFLNGKPEGAVKCKKGQAGGCAVEMYDHARFFTVTGNVYVDGNGARYDSIRANEVVLAKSYERWLAEGPKAVKAPVASKAPLSLSDDELLERMVKSSKGNEIQQLFFGDTSAYGGDDSAADLALCNHLAFWTGRDAMRMDALFRQSGLMRPKWDESRGESTYGELTIAKAIRDSRAYYNPEYGRSAYREDDETGKPLTLSGADIWDNPHLEEKHDKEGNLIGYMAPTVPALAWWMNEDPGLVGVRLEGMSQQITIDDGLPWNSDAKIWQTIDDDYLYARMQQRYKHNGKSLVRSDKNTLKAFSIFSHGHRYDVMSETIDGLPRWDGIGRKDTLLIDCLGAEDTPYVREVTSLFLRAAVARALEPGCKYDHMLVLQGRQGIGKSTLLRKLAIRPEFFADDIKNIGNKEAQELIQGRWIVEFAELAAFKGTRLETLKSFITSQTDSYRVPYAKRPQQMPRRCVLAGTTNLNEYLDDPTGNRRFLPVECTGTPTIDIFADGFEEYIAQVWAEAKADYMANPKKALVLPARVAAEADRKRERATTEDPWIGMTKRYLEGKPVGSFVCTSQILCKAIGKDKKDIQTSDSMRISQIVRTHCPDWVRTKSNRVIEGFGSQRAFEKVVLEPSRSKGVQQCLPGV